MKSEKKEIDFNVFNSVKSSAIDELLPEIFEYSFDLIIKSDVIKEIPIFGLGFKFVNLCKNIQDAFFTKKLLKFLIELKDISQDKRESFINNLEAQDKTKKAGEKLLITLDRLNDDDKATFVGRLFNQTISGNLEYDEFKRLTHIIHNAYIDDLQILKNNINLIGISTDVKSNLYQIGLVNQSMSDVNRERERQRRIGGNNDNIQPTFCYKINRIGMKFIEFGFNK